jgi:hypothetical protein
MKTNKYQSRYNFIRNQGQPNINIGNSSGNSTINVIIILIFITGFIIYISYLFMTKKNPIENLFNNNTNKTNEVQLINTSKPNNIITNKLITLTNIVYKTVYLTNKDGLLTNNEVTLQSNEFIAYTKQMNYYIDELNNYYSNDILINYIGDKIITTHYKNTNTYKVTQYNNYKNLDAKLLFGINNKAEIQLGVMVNYYLNEDLSIGVGIYNNSVFGSIGYKFNL